MRIVRSIADDLVYNISNRSIVTLKHCLLALGLHGMTGQKQPILLLSLFLVSLMMRLGKTDHNFLS